MRLPSSITEQPSPSQPVSNQRWTRGVVLGACAALLLYLCWRILLPFLPALCWAFALALIVHPVYAWLLRRAIPRNLAALAAVIFVAAVVVVPATFLARALVREAGQMVSGIAGGAEAGTFRSSLENNRALGPALRWLDARVDLPAELLQIMRSLATWASSSLSSVLTRSLWLLSQIGTSLFVLFYFLRDGAALAAMLRKLTPLPADEASWLFARIAQMIRVSLGGKLLVATLQGALGGLMFYWMGLPAPVFWGFVMVLLSVFPVIGSFVVWAPAALALAFEGNWPQALLLAGWGVLIIHPVDNVLGPMLVGTTLRLHTLLMFFAVVGGLAAFGASGIVLGPVTVAAVAGLVELAERRSSG